MHEYQFKINGNDYNVKILEMLDEKAAIEVNGSTYDVGIEKLFKQKTPQLVRKEIVETSISRPVLTEKPGRDLSIGTVKAPLPGVILSLNVKEGDAVKSGQLLLMMEAMKMENEIQSPVSGTVKEIFVKQGESVLEGAPLVKIE